MSGNIDSATTQLAMRTINETLSTPPKTSEEKKVPSTEEKKDEDEKEVEATSRTVTSIPVKQEAHEEVPDFVKRCLQKLAGSNTDEAWPQLLVAAAATGIDLARVINDREQLQPSQKKEIEKSVDHVGENASGALELWKLLKKEGVKNSEDLRKLKDMQAISSRQLTILKKGLECCGYSRFFAVASFAQADSQIHAIFLDAAKELAGRQSPQGAKWSSHNESDETELPLYRSRKTPTPKKPSDLGVNEGFDEFCHELGAASNRGLTEEQNNALAVVRLRILCEVVGVSFTKLEDEEVELAERLKIKAQIPLLKSCDAAIFYIFSALKDTVDQLQLTLKWKFTPNLLATIKKNFKDNKNIWRDLRGAKEVAGLDTPILTWLYSIASLLPESGAELSRQELNKKYNLMDWVKGTIIRTSPALLPRQLSIHAEPEYSVREPNFHISPVDAIVDELRKETTPVLHTRGGSIVLSANVTGGDS